MPRTAGVLVARRLGSVWVADGESAASGATVNCDPETGAELATISAIGWVVPPLTVSCSLGEAKECQSKVTGVVVAASTAKVKPEASFSAMYAEMNAPSGENVTMG